MLASRQPRSIFMLGTSSKADLTVILSAAARTRSMSSKVVGSSGDMSAGAWMDLARNGSAPPLRFPLGTPVKCFVGTDEWLRGTVVAHNYREPSWPASQLSAPYQILLTDDAPPDARNAIWAPADVDEIIQSDFRFGLGEVAECRLGEHEWVLCTVVGLLYRELKWPEGQYAPYQVRVDGVLPGSVDERAKTLADKRQLIWLPRDADDCIKARSALREERLKAAREQMNGMFNLGDIKVPTPYEVRQYVRATATAQATQAAASSTVINIDGADIGMVNRVLNDAVGAAAQSTAGTSGNKT